MIPRGTGKRALDGPYRVLFAALCWGAALAVFSLPIVNPDVFWHLSAARRMLAVGGWPRADWLSFTMEGMPWTDFEWLCQLWWYATLHLLGWWGLVTLKAGLFAAAALCFWKTLGLYAASLEAKALGVLAWSLAGISANDLRPENFSLAFFSLEWWFLEARRLGRGGPFTARWLVALYALWANIHPGFVFGGVLLAIYAAGEAARGRRWELAAPALACAGATLVNPYGWGLHRALWEHARDMRELQAYIWEWGRPDLLNVWMLPFWGTALAAFGAVLGRVLREKKAPVEHLPALCFFSLAAAGHNRFALYFVPIGVALAACHLPSWAWARRPDRRAQGIGLAALALMIFFAAKPAPILALRSPFLPRYVPDRLTRFLERERPAFRGRRMLAPWHWGGYLGYKLYPDMRVFADGRYIFHSFFAPLRAAKESPVAYQAFLDRYGIDAVAEPIVNQLFRLPVALSGGRRIEAPRPYYIAFLPEKAWALVYWSRQGAVFVRRSAFAEGWVAENEYRFLRPLDQAAAGILVKNSAASRRRLSQELLRFERWAPEDPESARQWKRLEGLELSGKAGR